MRLSEIFSNKSESKPIGAVESISSTIIPEGWVICDGSTLNAISNPQYMRLYEIIGTIYGGSDESNFNLPDLRGEFIRGADNGRNVDASNPSSPRTLGSFQSSKMKLHNHSKGSLSSPASNVPHTHPGATTGSSNVPHAHRFLSATYGSPSRWITLTGPGVDRFLIPATSSDNPAPHIHPGSAPSNIATHTHSSTGVSGPTGQTPNNREMRPPNIAVNYIIKI